jgi:hypothetical protein
MRTEVTETTGKLELLPNPCTTKPCLPGLALAVVTTEGASHFLTRDGKFYMHSNAVDTPSPGEMVVAVGFVQERQDVYGKSFKTIDVQSLERSE